MGTKLLHFLEDVCDETRLEDRFVRFDREQRGNSTAMGRHQSWVAILVPDGKLDLRKK